MIDPLPQTGATVRHVRVVAWQHALRAHHLAVQADEAAEQDERVARFRAGQSRMHAEVVSALLAAVPDAVTVDPAR